VVARNLAYAEKLRTGKIILDYSGDGCREIIVEDETATPNPNPVGDDSLATSDVVRSPSSSHSQTAAAK
jgi:hypothetical protein